MQDEIIKGTGNSRYLKSNIGADSTWEEALLLLRSGIFPIDLYGKNEEGIAQIGTPLNKANLLSDETAEAIGLSNSASVNDAIAANAKAIEKNSGKYSTVSLSPEWSGNGPYTQTVTIEGATENSQIRLQPNDKQLDLLVDSGVESLRIDNDNGTLIATARGGKPIIEMVLACSVWEVSA